MPNPTGWERSAAYWKTVPRRTNVVLLIGIFFLFTSFGLVLTLVNRTWVYMPWAMLIAVAAGICSVLWAVAGFRRILWLMWVLAPCQIGINILLGTLIAHHVSPYAKVDWSIPAIQHRLQVEGFFCMVTIVAGYVLIAAFIRHEGLRIFSTTAEMRLAAEVHQALVPMVSRRIKGFEFYGVSAPSGEVGGDLVDVAEHGQEWTAYVADVSGHGISAGMIMAMVKSAVRMGVETARGVSPLLSDLNRVLLSLSAENVFITFACIGGSEGSRVQFALAGHLPILHYRKRLGMVEELMVSNLPLAIMPDAEFTAGEVECEEGDVLAILTDGLTEAADKTSQELGLGAFKQELSQAAGKSLEQIAATFHNLSLQHGQQSDDQTVLLVRYGVGVP